MAEKTKVKYIYLTMNKGTLRVCIGIQQGMNPIIYAYAPGDFYSYCMYLNQITQEQGLEILKAAEEGNTRRAISLSKKYCSRLKFRDNLGNDGEYESPYEVFGKEIVENIGPIVLSDIVPDEWCDEIRDVRDYIDFKRVLGVYEYEREDYDL